MKVTRSAESANHCLARSVQPEARPLRPTRLPPQEVNQQFSAYAGAVSPFVRTSAIVAVKSSTPVLGTMMLLRRP
jgi:hypothetical protein